MQGHRTGVGDDASPGPQPLDQSGDDCFAGKVRQLGGQVHARNRREPGSGRVEPTYRANDAVLQLVGELGEDPDAAPRAQRQLDQRGGPIQRGEPFMHRREREPGHRREPALGPRRQPEARQHRAQPLQRLGRAELPQPLDRRPFAAAESA